MSSVETEDHERVLAMWVWWSMAGIDRVLSFLIWNSLISSKIVVSKGESFNDALPRDALQSALIKACFIYWFEWMNLKNLWTTKKEKHNWNTKKNSSNYPIELFVARSVQKDDVAQLLIRLARKTAYEKSSIEENSLNLPNPSKFEPNRRHLHWY